MISINVMRSFFVPEKGFCVCSPMSRKEGETWDKVREPKSHHIGWYWQHRIFMLMSNF